jgi:hypothetical protein
MDRRTFLASLIGTAAAKFFVPDENVNGVQLLPAQHPKPELPVILDFGGLKLLGQPGDNTLNILTPYRTCPITKTRTLERYTTVDVERVVCPEAVWKEILHRYSEVTKARENPPLKVFVGEQCVATIEYALFLSIGTQMSANGMIVVERVSLIGQWQELRKTCEAYEQNETKLAPALDFVNK